MSGEELLAALSELAEATQEMRRLQRAWFGGDKSRETLQAAKTAERRVDKLLAGLAAAVHPPPPPPQQKLF